MIFTFNVPLAWMANLGVAPQQLANIKIVESQCKDALLCALQGTIDLTQVKARRDEIDDGSAGLRRMTISLPNEPSMVLTTLARMLDLTPGPTAKLLLGMMNLGVIDSPTTIATVTVDKAHPLSILNNSLTPPRYARPEQASFYDAVWDSVTARKVGLIEGGTGIGKTLSMVAAAARWAQEYDSNSVIACPTLVLIRQFEAEYRRQCAAVPMPDLRVIVGRREYVSEGELRDFLGNRGKKWDSPELQDWLLRGLPNKIPDGMENSAWQIGWLDSLAPGFPIDEVLLHDGIDEADLGAKAYRRQFRRIETDDSGATTPTKAGIILCTHAMLAQDMRRKMSAARSDDGYRDLAKKKGSMLQTLKGKRSVDTLEMRKIISEVTDEMEFQANFLVHDQGLLPPFTCLIVDEAHQLEENFSNALSDSVALSRLITNLWKFKELGGKVSVETIQKAQGHVNTLITLGLESESLEMTLISNAGSITTNSLLEISLACAEIGNTRDTESDRYRLGKSIKQDGKLLEAAATHARTNAFLRYSPVRHFPQAYIGQQSVSGILSQLWSLCTGVALVSATLYLQRADGHSASYSSMLLAVPDDRVMTFAPIVARWAAAPVRDVYIPDFTGTWLRPPKLKKTTKNDSKKDQDAAIEDFKNDEKRWHKEIAHEIAKAWQTSVGGVLVLCTSYATVNAVRDELAQNTSSAHLIHAEPDSPLAQQSRKVLELSHSGVKPLWLAVGAAWTGVDIGGHTPWEKLFGTALFAEKDNVITDLIIPRMPFGTNRSITHAWRRKNRPNMPWDILDGAFRFKQALGRLVRREDLPKNRRIFVLDARIVDEELRGRYALFEQCLTMYSLAQTLRKTETS